MHDTTQSGLTRPAVSTGQSDELTQTRAPQALTRHSGTPQKRHTTDHPASEHQRPQPRVQHLWRSTTPSTGAVRGAPSRGGRFHPPTRVPCRPPRLPRADALRGGLTVLPVGVATRRRATATAIAATVPISAPHAPRATATRLCVPPGVLAAMEPVGVPGVDASPSALPP